MDERMENAIAAGRKHGRMGMQMPTALRVNLTDAEMDAYLNAYEAAEVQSVNDASRLVRS